MNGRILALVASLGLAACGGGSGATSEVDGTWATPCAASTNGPPGQNSGKSQVVFGGGQFTLTNTSYSDTACATAILTLTEAGSFVVGAAETTPASSKDISFTLSSNTATPLTADMATTLNTGGNNGGSICTGVTFSANTASSISGVVCGGANSTAQTADGTTLLNVYVLDTTATPHTIEFGSSNNDELGAATRPTTLNGTLLIKQ